MFMETWLQPDDEFWWDNYDAHRLSTGGELLAIKKQGIIRYQICEYDTIIYGKQPKGRQGKDEKHDSHDNELVFVKIAHYQIPMYDHSDKYLEECRPEHATK